MQSECFDYLLWRKEKGSYFFYKSESAKRITRRSGQEHIEAEVFTASEYPSYFERKKDGYDWEVAKFSLWEDKRLNEAERAMNMHILTMRIMQFQSVFHHMAGMGRRADCHTIWHQPENK
jgi:hypothetical protein